MATPSQLILHLRDCYEADNRETGIANLFGRKYRHVAFLGGTDDLLRGIQDRVPVDREKAVAAQKEASLYRKDKTLVFCALPLVGRTGGGNRLPSRLCAPLFFFPATVVEDAPAAFLSVDLAQQRVNFPVLAALAGQTETSRSVVEDLLGQFPEAPLGRDAIHGLMSLLMDVHRHDLSKFLRALKARSDVKQEKLFSDISLDVLFGTFPVWLVTLADVSSVLPLKAGLFDLAIIDEATQCDVASCLPVLQRARRAVIVGDPNQLRHVSFLSDQRQHAIAERNELDGTQQQRFQYRQKSVLDLLSETLPTQEHVLFLDEHFRSMPQIIAFSNREFYAGALKVMTQRPETAELRCVELRLVPAGQKEHGVNRREARALVDEVVGRNGDRPGRPARGPHAGHRPDRLPGPVRRVAGPGALPHVPARRPGALPPFLPRLVPGPGRVPRSDRPVAWAAGEGTVAPLSASWHAATSAVESLPSVFCLGEMPCDTFCYWH